MRPDLEYSLEKAIWMLFFEKIPKKTPEKNLSSRYINENEAVLWSLMFRIPRNKNHHKNFVNF